MTYECYILDMLFTAADTSNSTDTDDAQEKMERDVKVKCSS